MVSIMIFGPFSGGNFNPAVTVMMVAKGAQPASDLLPYIVAQVAGGLAALELYKRVKI
jgi:aquaporin Z